MKVVYDQASVQNCYMNRKSAQHKVIMNVYNNDLNQTANSLTL